MKYNKYTIETTTAAEDFISSMLSDLGIEGVEIEDNIPLTSEDTAKMFIDFLPELPPDDGVSHVSFYLDASQEQTDILLRVRKELEELRSFVEVGAGTIAVSQTEDADWANNWKEFFHAFTIDDRILIKPTWEDTDVSDQGKILIEIDPGISFGTGKHETTQLCIRQLLKYLKPGDHVLDLGCGSGILSIVSLKLGAGHLAGTDVDEDCIASTRENFAVNHLDFSNAEFYVGNLIDDEQLQGRLCTGGFDIVAANILADVIIPMAPRIPSCLKDGGIFISSGIIDFKEQEVLEAIRKSGLKVLEVTHQGEWVSVTAQK